MALQSFRPIQGNILTIVLPTGEAINEGEAVKLSSNAIVKAGDGETVIGITAASAASGAQCSVYVMGEFEGTAASGVNFAPGDVVYMAASQELDTGSMGNKGVGAVVGTDPSTAGKVRFWLTSSLFHDSLTHA